mmetsp:Transcript_3852/g.5858  ORF Transcript_3852/g.5858 Transcript_3852/m.5858 type:complete len:121 (+) Transcript_3852:1156-1518(+)
MAITNYIPKVLQFSISSVSSLARLAWAFTYLSYDSALFPLIAQHFSTLKKNILCNRVPPNALANAAWAFTFSLNMTAHTDLIYSLLSAIIKKNYVDSLSSFELALLHGSNPFGSFLTSTK